jgi:hypothetical protein
MLGTEGVEASRAGAPITQCRVHFWQSRRDPCLGWRSDGCRVPAWCMGHTTSDRPTKPASCRQPSTADAQTWACMTSRQRVRMMAAGRREMNTAPTIGAMHGAHKARKGLDCWGFLGRHRWDNLILHELLQFFVFYHGKRRKSLMRAHLGD